MQNDRGALAAWRDTSLHVVLISSCFQGKEEQRFRPDIAILCWAERLANLRSPSAADINCRGSHPRLDEQNTKSTFRLHATHRRQRRDSITMERRDPASDPAVCRGGGFAWRSRRRSIITTGTCTLVDDRQAADDSIMREHRAPKCCAGQDRSLNACYQAAIRFSQHSAAIHASKSSLAAASHKLVFWTCLLVDVLVAPAFISQRTAEMSKVKGEAGVPAQGTRGEQGFEQ